MISGQPHLNGRKVVLGTAGLGNIVPNTSIPGGDATQCATLTPGFSGDVGTDDVDNNHIGGYIVASPIPSNTVLPGSEVLELRNCPTGDGVTTAVFAVGDFVAACTNPRALEWLGFDSGAAFGFNDGARWGESFYADEWYNGPNGGIISSGVTAQVFDPTALNFVFAADEDYFALLLASDGPAGLLNTILQATPDLWSAINANGPGPGMMVESFCTGAIPLAALSTICNLPCIGTFCQIGGLVGAGSISVSLECPIGTPILTCTGSLSCAAVGPAGSGNGRCFASVTVLGVESNFFCYDP